MWISRFESSCVNVERSRFEGRGVIYLIKCKVLGEEFWFGSILRNNNVLDIV